MTERNTSIRFRSQEGGAARRLFLLGNPRAVDLNEGPNVDVVLTSHYKSPKADGHYHLMISGRAFEYVKFFGLTWLEMVRTLKPGGLIFLIAPPRGPEDRFPLDCCRFYPDATARSPVARSPRSRAVEGKIHSARRAVVGPRG